MTLPSFIAASLTCLTVSLVSGLVSGGEAPVITRAEDVRKLSQVEAIKRIPVKVRGVVTWAGDKSVVIQDDSAGVYAVRGDLFNSGLWQGDDALFARLRPGMLLEIEGVTDLGGFAPIILARTMLIVGTQALPKPQPMVPSWFFGGSQDAQRIEVRGVVQGYRIHEEGATLLLSANPGRFRAFTRARGMPDPASLVDAEVRIVGVQLGGLNARGEAPVPRIEFNQAEDLVIEKPPQWDPFDAPKLERGSIGQFRAEPLNAHRLRIEGTVTYVGPENLLYVQMANLGIRVKTRDSENLQIGDRIEVSGFPDENRFVRGIEEAVVRKTGSGAIIPPIKIEPEEIIERNAALLKLSNKPNQEDFDGQLVRFNGRLVEIVDTLSRQPRLVLETQSSIVFALMPGKELSARGRPANGSTLSVTGIVQQLYEGEASPNGYMTPTRIELLLRDRNDITVIKESPFWTAGRLYWLTGILLLALALGALWIKQLRRVVARQAKLWEHTMRVHRDSQLELKGAREERYRLAGDLHDGLLQHLSGAAYRLEAALMQLGDQPPEIEEQFSATRAALERTRIGLRECLLGLRSVEEGPAEFSALLRHASEKMEHWPKGALQIFTNGDPFPLSRHVMGTLLLFMQEAVANAYTHGAATHVQVRLNYLPEMLEMLVIDNGSGFDPALAQGSSVGHFGVESMRHRLRWLGGSMDIHSQPGEGTHIIARLSRKKAEGITEPAENHLPSS